MKIVFVVMRFGKDGLATNILELTRGLINKGHELHIITSGFKSIATSDTTFFEELKSEFNTLGVHLHYFTEPSGNPLKKILASVTSLSIISGLLIKLNADVIHCHSPNLTFIPWLLRKKFISTVHADTIRPNARYKHPTLLIAVSQGSQEFTESVMHSPPEHIRMVYHGISDRFANSIPDDELKKLKIKHAIPTDKLIIGFVGRISEMKGTDILVEAIGSHLSQTIKENIHIVLVGDYLTKSKVKWLDDMLHEKHLEEKVTIVSFQDPKPFYQLFDVFVLPSRSDTFGLVAVEAMMSGCCTIRADSNGAYDQIDDGINGMIFPMEDASALGQKLTQVLSDEKLRNSLAIKGKEKALSNFTNHQMIKNTLTVYEELIHM
ncbi:Glycosyltransferase involved in cell wall bisynthesis [Maribacter orientalis]|uniref:Glycosyltransferase involved in cell wall bisynthesis n=1 Tax=Maribacter orientalis TaxID=228957 RepID=A0A1H7SGV8_9FLAO|nr:glycosyltransferase family 4 protein [Maribacter orientalis]SEL71658.1 Glycosyltransferase involved in cell wall bisynthesis [Maribacter orientalis]